MLRVHKIELNPNNKQKTFFSQHCGFARVAYNEALAIFKDGLNIGVFHSEIDLRKRFNQIKGEKYEWSTTHSQQVGKNAIRQLGNAIEAWVKKQNRFPRFKRKGVKDSYQADNGRNTVQVEGNRIKLPKIGWVRMKENLRFRGDIMSTTVSRIANKWFVSVSVDTVPDPLPHISHLPVVGVDVGIKHLAVTSEGDTFENPKALRRYEHKLKRLQRELSRRKKGGKNWHKTKAKLAKLHYRIACIRDDSHHKATTTIVNGCKGLGIESLNVAGMLKNHKLAQALADTSLHKFLTYLKYKADRIGVKIVEADRFYPSSKTCSNCGVTDSDLTLSDRTYHCSDCGHEIDRDLNAAINLRNVAISCMET